jgi:hypothetical protein
VHREQVAKLQSHTVFIAQPNVFAMLREREERK